MCVHPVAEEVDKHQDEERECVEVPVQPGQHQQQPRGRAPIRDHVKHRAEPRSWYIRQYTTGGIVT